MGRAAMVLAAACWELAGCSPLPVTVAARPLTPIAKGTIRRIAVVPFTTADVALGPTDALGAAPLSEPPGDTVTRAVETALREQGDWVILDDLTVGEAFRRLYGEVRAPTASEAAAVGTLLRADAVLRGQVLVFEERIGAELAANRPAHVVFAVELLRPTDGVPLWQGEYSERQQSLSENLWNLPGFVRAGGTWVRAGELAQIGAARIAARLHDALYGPPARRRCASKTTR